VKISACNTHKRFKKICGERTDIEILAIQYNSTIVDRESYLDPRYLSREQSLKY